MGPKARSPSQEKTEADTIRTRTRNGRHPMCITLIGGIDRLKQDYIRTARKRGVDLKCILHDTPDFKSRIGSPDAVVIFTKQISHEARRKALEHARSQNIQVHMLHSCSVSSLWKCIKER